MDSRFKTLVAKLRSLGSEEAAKWIVSNYPTGGDHVGDAINSIAHLSWKSQDQIFLARHYLKGLPFANPRPYDVFLSFMPIRKFLPIVEEFFPADPARIELLMYYLIPSLQSAAKTETDRLLVESFKARHNKQMV